MNVRSIALVVAALCVLLAGCAAPLPSASPTATPSSASQRPNLGVANGTTLTVTLVVNGQRVAVFPSGGPEPSIDLTALPPLPWTVEALSPSGRVLTAFRVELGAVSLDANGYRSATSGPIDLSCGRLMVWAGPMEPPAPAPAASPGVPGDCAP